MASAWCAIAVLYRQRTRSCKPTDSGKESTMKISIGGQDYSAALDAAKPLQITRKLNEPSVCEFALSLPSDVSLTIPARMAQLLVTGDDGTSYFTGYVAG